MVLRELDASPDGLSSIEAARRLERFGPNELAVRRSRSWPRDLGRQFTHPLARGETARRRAPDARGELTPQEMQIATMAAEGLSNREIGQRLFLTHRTVGSHLYRLVPKLGITTRLELPTALAERRS